MVAVRSFLPSDEWWWVAGGLARSVVVDMFVVVSRALTGQTSRTATSHLVITNIAVIY